MSVFLLLDLIIFLFCLPVRPLFFSPVESFTSATEFVTYQRQDDHDEFEPCAVAFDADNGEHMTWVYLRAKERAEQFNIKGLKNDLFHSLSLILFDEAWQMVGEICNSPVFYQTILSLLFHVLAFYIRGDIQPDNAGHQEYYSGHRLDQCPHLRSAFLTFLFYILFRFFFTSRSI
jgi:hypothetical protein